MLKILSEIWKCGAEMSLGDDGKIELKKHQLVPAELMRIAEQDFSDIEKWFISWKNATPVQLTLWKSYQQYCNWGRNEKILNWLNVDEHGALMMNKWLLELEKNGWNDMYEDYRPYENKKTNELAEQIFKNAVAFATANKSVEESK